MHHCPLDPRNHTIAHYAKINVSDRSSFGLQTIHCRKNIRHRMSTILPPRSLMNSFRAYPSVTQAELLSSNNTLP